MKLAALTLGLLGAAALAAAAEIDLKEFDTLLMQDMDDTVKDLEPLIGGRDAKAATEAVVFLEEGLTWTEQFFAAQGATDGVKFARQGKERAAVVRAALGSGDFSEAAAAARDVAKSCRACHDVYRP